MVESGATIDSTNHLQNGSFSYPVNNSSILLQLKTQVPTNTLNDMSFSSGGSLATGTVNIDTTGASAGTLTLDSYTGDLSGADYDNDPTYLLSWLGATNTIDVTQEATSPASVDAGSTYNMGRFGFQHRHHQSEVDLNRYRRRFRHFASAALLRRQLCRQRRHIDRYQHVFR